MPTILQNKKVLMLIAGFAIVAIALIIFGRPLTSPAAPASPAAPYLSVAPAASADAAVGQDLLAALALLRTIQLDTSIFSDPIFESLSDWGKTIPPQPIGRRNPFAPLGAPKSAVAAKPPPAASTPSAASALPVASSPPASAQPPVGGAGNDVGVDSGVWDFSDIEFEL